MQRPIDLVVNPRAGSGRAARILPALRRALLREGFEVRVHFTERPGHAGDIVRRLREEGRPLVGVVGGDGSFHEALAGTLDEAPEVAERCALAVLPAGTGGDLRRTLGVPLEPDAQARWLARATPRPFDVGELTFVTHDGREARRRFGNIASFGISGVVDKLVNRGPKWLGGRVAFFGATVAATVGYANVRVRVRVDGAVFYEGPVLNVAVCNGQYFGGGMHVAPMADPRDGRLEVVCMGDFRRVEAVANSPSLYRGTHLEHRKITHTQGLEVSAEELDGREALLDLDGEQPGRLPARFRVVPGALRVLST